MAAISLVALAKAKGTVVDVNVHVSGEIILGDIDSEMEESEPEPESKPEDEPDSDSLRVEREILEKREGSNNDPFFRSGHHRPDTFKLHRYTEKFCSVEALQASLTSVQPRPFSQDVGA
jgi:hypothetical protein